ncbi:MAG: ABC transporter ATP-binding protein [Planctomycetota bacterium]
MTRVRLDNVTKRFGPTVALDNVSIDIESGELFFLLGPSGCGKSTLLRLIAGLHEPTSGKLWFDDNDVTSLSTEKRNAVMCFQSYALWPHMTVRENIRFGLNVRDVSKADQDARIDEVLALVQMTPYADRKPNQLSGGQQQRVALARALAVKPACLLLDEPLSNLDAKLRHEMRSEIRRICKEAGFTTIYVTHDQKEALSVADRIAVLKDGQLMQIGSPGELYHQPHTAFVADFIGQTNLISGKVLGHDGDVVKLDTPFGELAAKRGPDDSTDELTGDVTLSIRPEQMQLDLTGRPPRLNRLVGKEVEHTFLGEASEHLLDIGGEPLKVIAAPPVFEVPDEVAVSFDAEDVVIVR